MTEMNDYQLWQEYIEAQKRVDELYEEIKRRELHKKPIVQWSKFASRSVRDKEEHHDR